MRVILMTLAAFVCGQLYSQVSSPSYKIVGYIEGMPDQELYLDYYDKGVKYRHPTFSKDGNFQFMGKVSEPVFANIHHQNGNGEIELFLDNSLWKVTGTYQEYNDAAVLGSGIDAQWKQYFKEDQQLVKNASFKGDPVVVHQRKELLKKYVKDLHSSYAGALIPNFCTIEKSLTPADWIEIYDFLSEDMKDSYYGRKIKAKIQKP